MRQPQSLEEFWQQLREFVHEMQDQVLENANTSRQFFLHCHAELLRSNGWHKLVSKLSEPEYGTEAITAVIQRHLEKHIPSDLHLETEYITTEDWYFIAFLHTLKRFTDGIDLPKLSPKHLIILRLRYHRVITPLFTHMLAHDFTFPMHDKRLEKLADLLANAILAYQEGGILFPACAKKLALRLKLTDNCLEDFMSAYEQHTAQTGSSIESLIHSHAAEHQRHSKALEQWKVHKTQAILEAQPHHAEQAPEDMQAYGEYRRQCYAFYQANHRWVNNTSQLTLDTLGIGLAYISASPQSTQAVTTFFPIDNSLCQLISRLQEKDDHVIQEELADLYFLIRHKMQNENPRHPAPINPEGLHQHLLLQHLTTVLNHRVGSQFHTQHITALTHQLAFEKQQPDFLTTQQVYQQGQRLIKQLYHAQQHYHYRFPKPSASINPELYQALLPHSLPHKSLQRFEQFAAALTHASAQSLSELATQRLQVLTTLLAMTDTPIIAHFALDIVKAQLYPHDMLVAQQENLEELYYSAL